MRSDKNALKKTADAVHTAYRLFRPLLGPRACRFHPTCSEYSFQSFKTYGLLRGAFLSAARILRCHPWNPGGYDPVPLSQPPSAADLNIANIRETN
ncbi:MAG: membrane protein insertion efficiency factor YidD [Elusimicrobiota bacterium]